MYSKEKQSFGLVRTNAALTGNVKLTVTSDYALSVNSIDGHPALADIKFKAVPTSESSSWHQDIARFFGSVSPSAIFNVDAPPVNVTSENLDNQFDFRYTAGAKRCATAYYKEQFSFFAPIQVGEALPNAFVIYRLEGAADEGELTGDPAYAKDLQSSMKNAKFITSFDMTEKSALGRYLRKTTNRPEYLQQSFTFRKDEDIDRYFLDWTGISVIQPVLATLSEDVTSFFKRHASLIDFEQHITEGRQRLGLVDHRIINMEFMFNDVDAADYTINRYIGFYVDTVPTGTISLDGVRAFRYRDLDGNMPRLKREQGGAYAADGDFYQNNPTGVCLYFNQETGELPVADNTWIKGKDNTLFGMRHGLKVGSELIALDEPLGKYQLILDNKNVNIGSFRGTSDTQIVVPVRRAAASSKSFFVLDLIEMPGEFDRILIEHPAGNRICKEDSGVPTDAVTDYYLDIDTSHLWIRSDADWTDYGLFEGRLPRKVFEIEANDFSETDPTWGPGSSLFSYYNAKGTKEEVTSSICAAINGIKTEFLIARVIDGKIIVYVKANGEYDSRRIFSTFDCGHGKNKVFTFVGGAKQAVRYSTTSELASQVQDLCYVSSEGVEFVKQIVLDLNHTLTHGVLTHSIIELKSEPISATKTKLILYKTLEPEVGKFTFHDWRELDGDFLDNSYASTEIELLRSYYDIPDGKDALVINAYYNVGGSGSILCGSTTIKSGTAESPSVFQATHKSFKIVEGFPIVYQYQLIDEEMKTIKGVSSLIILPSMQEIVDGGLAGKNNPRIRITDPLQRLEVFNARDRFTRFIAKNEYDSLKENETTTHSLISRTLPWISKWVHLYGTDTRDNSYRFNMSSAFGKNNLSPSFFTKTVSSNELTHEWFYIEGLGRNLTENAWHIDDTFNMDSYVENEVDEFSRFFKYRYVSFKKTIDGSTCIFKGVQYNMPARVAGYKFSIVMKRTDPTPGLPPIAMKLYENPKFKNILMVLELSLLDYRIYNNVVDHILMYAGKSIKSDMNTVNDSYLSSALDFSNASVHKGNLIVPIVDRYNTDLRNEIVKPASIKGISADYSYGVYKLGPPNGVREKQLLFSADTKYYATEYDEDGELLHILLPFMTRGFWKDNIVHIKGGGDGLFHRTMERLSFGYVNQLFVDDPKEIISKLIGKDGLQENTMDLNSTRPVIVSKLNNPFYSEDIQKPENLINTGKIGYKIENREELVNLARYPGPYVAKTRPCIWFDEDGKISNQSGTIRNVHGVKVGETNILSDLGAPNAYRLINEFPLFNTDLNVFTSSWAKNFYKRFTNSTVNVSVEGTKVIKEIDNFFGNILMNLPNEIYIQTFTESEYSIRGNGDAVTFNLELSVTQQIIEEAPEIFKKIAGKDYKTLISQYVKENVMKLYKIISFDTFVRSKPSLPNQFVSIGDSARFKAGFVRSTALRVEQVDGYIYVIDTAGSLNGSYEYTTSILLELI